MRAFDILHRAAITVLHCTRPCVPGRVPQASHTMSWRDEDSALTRAEMRRHPRFDFYLAPTISPGGEPQKVLRNLSLLTVTVMLLGILAACGGGQPAGQAPAATTAAEPTGPPNPLSLPRPRPSRGQIVHGRR